METEILQSYIEVQKPTIEEMLEANKDYIEWLEDEISKDAANNYKKEIINLIASTPPTGFRIPSPLVSLGDSLIWPYTSKIKGVPTPSDPINIIFYKKGKANIVNDKLVNDFMPPWNDIKRCSGTQFTYIDNSHFGGYKGWIDMKFSLSNCVCLGFLKRCHIRLFDCVDREPKQFGNFTVAGVHYEEGLLPLHKIYDWDGSQQFINCLLITSFSFVGSKNKLRLQRQNEVIQGIKHDGLADAIEIK